MKRMIAILLAAVLLLSMIPMASAAGNMANFARTKLTFRPNQFVDVRSTDWFLPGVRSAYELGLMRGVTDTMFKPGGNLTVAEALTIACRIYSVYTGIVIPNIQTTPWYQVYVDYAAENQIVPKGQMDPAKQITREQFAYLMCGSLPATELNEINTITEIPDVAESSPYGGFIYCLYRAGVLSGSDKYGTFKPTTNIQRSEIATIVSRMADKSQRKTVTLVKRIQPTDIQLAGRTELKIGDNTTWSVKLLPAGAESRIIWSAGNPEVATVDQTGKITAHKAGACDITARTVDGVLKTVRIKVSAPISTGTADANGPVKITLRDTLPKALSSYYSNSCTITGFSYTINSTANGVSTITLQFAGEKTFDENGVKQNRPAQVNWKLYDSENYVVASGSAYSSPVLVGEKFKDCRDTINALENGVYYLSIMDI